MIFTETALKGAYIIQLEPVKDERGSLLKTFCHREYLKHGLNLDIIQSSILYNKKRGTLRGLYYQKPPFEDIKIISAIRGSVYAVIIDLRRNSKTYCQWYAIELTEKFNKILYVPKGLAHGFQSLTDDSAVQYQMSEYYHPEHNINLRWDDPAFNIKWPPCEERLISEKR